MAIAFKPITQNATEKVKLVYNLAAESRSNRIFTNNSEDCFEKLKLEKLTITELKKFVSEADKLVKNKFRGLEITRNIPADQIDRLYKAFNHGGDDTRGFLLFATSNKPAFFTDGIDSKTLKILKHNGIDSIKTDTYFEGINKNVTTTTLLKKEEVKKVIENNLEIYQKRMGLPSDTDSDTIYKALLAPDSPLHDHQKYSDLIGLTLGFPRDNALIFRLYTDNRSKESIKKLFLSDESPYKDFSPTLKNHLLNQIERIKLDDEGYGEAIEDIINEDKAFANIFPMVAYVDEPAGFANIIDYIRTATAKMTEINRKQMLK